MEQITREEMIGLLQILADLPSTETKQGRGVRRRVERAIAALQAAEPAGYGLKGLFTKQWDGKTFVEKEDADSYEEAALLPLFALPCPPAKAADEDDLDAQLQHFWGSCYWSNLLRNNPSLSDETKTHLLDKSEEIDRLRAAVMQSPPATELAPESWREELETIAEILEADGDEWNCAARIRKILKTSPSEAQVPEGWKLVPVEPTAEMVGAACDEEQRPLPMWSRMGAIYKAMLAASPAPDHSGGGNEMVEVPFHKLALGTRFRYTSIPESEYVKISATQVARWQDDMAIAGWAGQGVYSFDEKDRTDTKVLVAVPIGLRQQEETER